MRKIICLLLICVLILFIIACKYNESKIIEEVKGFDTYYKMSNDTWQYKGFIYKYRLEISGIMPNTNKVVTYIYLSNLENITFNQALMASGLSSNLNDYFQPNEAVLVDWVVN